MLDENLCSKLALSILRFSAGLSNRREPRLRLTPRLSIYLHTTQHLVQIDFIGVVDLLTTFLTVCDVLDATFLDLSSARQISVAVAL